MPRGVYNRQEKQDGIKEEDDVLIMHLKLASGRFESSIQIPLHSADEDKKKFVEAWLSLMEMGLKCSPNRKGPTQ
jgi:hypothetical protein